MRSEGTTIEAHARARALEREYPEWEVTYDGRRGFPWKAVNRWCDGALVLLGKQEDALTAALDALRGFSEAGA